MASLSSVANAVGKASIGAPDDRTAGELAAKQQGIDEYKNATKPTFSADPVRDTSPSMKDKIAPKARYGARPGEQRIDTTSMTKPLGSFKKGTDSVPKTGIYKVHKGEAVIPKDTAIDTFKRNWAGKPEDKDKTTLNQSRPSYSGKMPPASDSGADSALKESTKQMMNMATSGSQADQPINPMVPSFKHGTPSVPKTGLALLHKGEAVIPKDKNPMKQVDKAMSSAKDMMGDEQKPKKAIKHIETRKTHDGKFVHTHKHHHPDIHKDEEHVSNNMAELKKHMEDHMGGEPDGDESGAGVGAPAQMTAQAPPMPAAPAAGAGPMPGAM
jgi:hypothetical protein